MRVLRRIIFTSINKTNYFSKQKVHCLRYHYEIMKKQRKTCVVSTAFKSSRALRIFSNIDIFFQIIFI